MTTMPESFFGWVTFLLHQYGDVLLKGACVTLLLAIVGTLIGCVIGLVVGIIQTIPEDPKASAAKKALVKVTQLVLNAYVELFRGTPMIVQAMVVYYGAMSMFNIDMSPMFAGFLVVSINTGAYMAETVRGGIESIDPGLEVPETPTIRRPGVTDAQAPACRSRTCPRPALWPAVSTFHPAGWPRPQNNRPRAAHL